MQVTPGYQLPNDTTTKLTRANLNLMAQPVVVLEAGEVTDAKVASGISGSKIDDIPVSSLGEDVQAKFGLKNYIPNPQFNNWLNGESVALAASGSALLGWDYTNAGSVSGYIQRADVLAGESDSILKDSENWLQIATSSTSASEFSLHCKIPNARLFSGQDITISFASRIFSGTVPTLSCSVVQNFGTGGSPSAPVETAGVFNAQPAVSTAKNYATITVPSVSGKTFGTNDDSYLQLKLTLANCSTTFNLGLTNIQLESGDTATSFENGLFRYSGSEYNVDNSICNAVLTLTTGVPILSSDVLSTDSVFITPYKGNCISLFNGASWGLYHFAETEVDISELAQNSAYDIFAYPINGKVAFEILAWTNTTTRATALAYQDGILCKSGYKSKRYIGSFATLPTTAGHTGIMFTGTLRCTDSTGSDKVLDTIVTETYGYCLIYSHYADFKYAIKTADDSDSYIETTTGSTIRSNNYKSTKNKVVVFRGVALNQRSIGITHQVAINTTSASNWLISAGLNSTSNISEEDVSHYYNVSGNSANLNVKYSNANVSTSDIGLLEVYPLVNVSAQNVTTAFFETSAKFLEVIT